MAQNNGGPENNLTLLDINSLNPEENEFVALLQRSLVGKEKLIRCLLAIKNLMANVGHDKNLPIGILLCGPSGTGKTLTSELIAECFLGDRDGLFRIWGFQEITNGMIMKAWEPHLPKRVHEITAIINRELEEYAVGSIKAHRQKDENGRQRRSDSQKTLRALQKRAVELQNEHKDELGGFGVKLEISSQGEIGVAIKRDCLRVIVVEGVDMLPRKAQGMFASILETGRIRIDDNQEIGFENSIFIFTAKKDCEKLLKGKNGRMGFSQGSKKDKDEQVYGKLMPILKKNVDELLLCRLFKIIVWGYLTEEQMNGIFDIFVRTAVADTSEKGLPICVEIHQEVKDYIIERSLKDGYREYGAWRLATLVNDEILSKIERLRSTKQIDNGDIIVIKLAVKGGVKEIEFFKRTADADDKNVVVPCQIIG